MFGSLFYSLNLFGIMNIIPYLCGTLPVTNPDGGETIGLEE
jgi:hypothetical protein